MKPIILLIPMTPVIQITRTYNLQNDKSYSHFLPKFHFFTFDSLSLLYRFRQSISKTATCCPKLITNIHRYLKPIIPCKLFEVSLPQQNQYQLLNIKNGFFKAFSNISKSKIKQYTILNFNYYIFQNIFIFLFFLKY